MPVENTLDYAHARRARQVPFELHLFQDGPHAMGLADRESARTRPTITPTRGLASAVHRLAERKRMMEQKVVLITGGSRGIGAATARRFAAGGCKVVTTTTVPRPRPRPWRRRLGAGRCRQTWPIRSKWEEWLTMCWINIVNLTF